MINKAGIGPTWPFGTKQYRQIFNQQLQYEEEMYTGYAAPGYPYGYPSYRYPPVSVAYFWIETGGGGGELTHSFDLAIRTTCACPTTVHESTSKGV